MWDKLGVLNNSYQELSDCLMDLLKYEFVGLEFDCSVISIINKMLENTQLMIDNIDNFEWSDVMKVRQSNYTAIRLINTLLINQYDIIINKEKDKIYLGGIDDTLLGNPDIKSTTSYLKENNDTYSIILVHEPDYSDNILKEQKVDLILSGHSHNGQVRIPIIGALYTPNGAKKYYKNYYTINNTKLYISSGIGNTDLNLRLFNRPSINFYRINTKKDS